MLHDAPAVLWESAQSEALRCTACAHRCFIKQGSHGACGVRQNREGALHAPYGFVAACHVRPVETNTIFHVAPGEKALSFGMVGCDLRCPYCHNARLSQSWREGAALETTSPAALVHKALDNDCKVLCAAYNEPMVSAEWAHDVFGAAHDARLLTAMVSDGHTTREALTFMRPVMDCYRIDLKGFAEDQYRLLGGRLKPVLDGIEIARALGYWVEVVTLVVPGLNDDLHGLRQMARHLAAIDRDIPWHINGFVPRHQMSHVPATSIGMPLALAGSAYAQGLRYVYVSNFTQPHPFGETRCPGCQMVLVRRENYHAVTNSIRDGACPACACAIPGRWLGSTRAAHAEAS